MSFLQKLFGRQSGIDRAVKPVCYSPCPDELLFLVPDLHGRLDLLDRALALRHGHYPSARLIVLGDMIDRGPDSAGVLSRLRRCDPASTICLLGNHEAMLLQALEQPERHLFAWLHHGGLETCWSFGLHDVSVNCGQPKDLAARLESAIGPDSLTWLRSLPLSWQSGNVVAVHAALDPDRAVFDQKPDVMLWGHPQFERTLRKDEIWVAHGHTILAEAGCAQGRISLDTGAYATNHLAVAIIDPTWPEARRVSISELTAA